MEKKKLHSLSLAALIVSVLPLATLIPVALKITMADGLRTGWAVANMVCILAGLILSIVCVKSEDSRSALNIVSTIISGILLLMVLGIVALALFLSFIQRG